MELRMDVGQSGQAIVSSLEPSHLWIVGLAAPDDRPTGKPQSRPYSFATECECPEDCLKDHDNE